MKDFEKHRSNLRNLAQKMKQALQDGESFKGSAFKEEYQHISDLIARLSKDKDRIGNWNKLGEILRKKMGVNADSFKTQLEAVKNFLDNPKPYAQELEDLCTYVGETDLDDAKFIYKWHCLASKDKNFAYAIKLLANYKRNVLKVEKEYYEIFYSFSARPKYNRDYYIIDLESRELLGMALLVALKSFLFLLIPFLILYMAGVMNPSVDIGQVVVAAIAGIIPIALGACIYIGSLHLWDVIAKGLIIAVLFIFYSPIFKMRSESQKKKILEQLEEHNPNIIEASFADILKEIKTTIAEMEDASEVVYCPALEDIASHLWHARTLEGAAQEHLDCKKFGKEFAEWLRSGSKSPLGSNSFSSSSSYSSSNSYSSSKSESSYDPLSWKPDINQKERILQKLREKPLNTVAIYHSLVVDQWLRLDKWGKEEYVSIERTNYGDFFVARDGETYKIKTFPLQRDEIYFYQPK